MYRYRKILVPLDGSELAECALPVVRDMAKAGDVWALILLKIVEINITTWKLMKGVDYFKVRETIFDQSQQYLKGVKSKLSSDVFEISTEVIESYKPAHVICDYAQKKNVTLIAIATHGYTGMKKMLLGSVAFRVLHESHVPILLIRPESCKA